MKRIKNFGGFIKNLYEGTSISLTGTYLEPSNQRASGTISKSNYSQVRKRFGKVFKEAPTTEGKNWGLKFVESGSGYNNSVNYKVVFPADFVSNFVTFMTRMGRKLDDVAKKFGLSSSVELLKKIKSGKLDDKIPKTVSGVSHKDIEELNRRADKNSPKKTGKAIELMNMIPGEYWKFVDFGMDGIGIREKEIDWKLLENVTIQREREDYQFNRIHMLPGIPDEFKGTGLGYIVYEEFIKNFGYARSEQRNASGDAQKVWSQLARDPDFMTIISQCSDRSAEVFLIHKDCKVPNMSGIIIKYINHLKKNSNLISIKYEDSILDKYTDLDKKDFKIVIAKDPNLFSKFFTKLQDIMNGQSTTSFTEIEDFSKSLIDDIEFHETRIKNLNDDLNNFQITPETKFKIFPNYTTSERYAVDRFFESNTDKVDSILSISLLSLMKKTDLEKLRDKLPESLFEFLKVGKILLLERANQEVQEKFIKEIVETLKEDLKLFNNPKFKFLYAIFLPIQNIFEIVSKHKRSGEDVSSMEKVVNSYIYHNIFDMDNLDEFVEDYLDEFKPDLTKFEPITTSQTDESYSEKCSQIGYIPKKALKYYNLFPDKIKPAFIIEIFDRTYDEEFKEIIRKINFSNLSKSQEFKESLFKSYLGEAILRVIFSENVVTVTEFLELKKFVLENKHKRVIICHSLEKIMTTKNESKLDDLIDFLRKNDLIIQLRYMGDDSLDKQERESLTKWFFDVDINIIDKLVKNSIISTEFIFEIHRSYSKESDEVVEYLLQNDKNINIDKLIVLAESPEMKKKIRRLDKVTDNPSRREDYFFDMFPEEDSSDDVVEWLNKNQRDGQDQEFIMLCLMAVLVSTNKKMTLSKLSKLSLNSLVTIFETVYKGENFVLFSDDDHKKQILRNDDRVNKFDKFFQKKNIVDFYSAFLPYIKDTDFKKAIEQFLNQPTNEKKILNYKSFIKK